MNNYLNKWKDTPCLQIRKLVIVKMAILPKLIYRLKVIFIKIQAYFLQIYMEMKDTDETIQKNKNKVGILRLSNF